MRKRISILASIVVLLFTQVVFASNVDTAIGYMKAGQYPQAVALLEEAVQQSPQNAKFHLLLGNAYALQGNVGAAENQFKSAVKLNPSYGKQVGQVFKDAALEMLEINQTNQARTFFRKYLEYQPKQQAKLAEELYQKGKSMLDQQIFGPEEGYLTIASELNFLLKEKASKDYINAGNKASDKQCIYFYQKAKKLLGYPDPAVEKRVLEYGQSIAGFKDRETEFALYKNDLVDFLGIEKVEQVFPRYKTFYPGQKEVISLKAGQRTTYKINFSVGDLSYTLGSNNDRYLVHFSDGTSYEAWNLKRLPSKTNPEIILEAVDEDQVITVYRKP